MRMKWDRALKKPLAAGAICSMLAAQYVMAQNLGQNPGLGHSDPERSEGEESRSEATDCRDSSSSRRRGTPRNDRLDGSKQPFKVKRGRNRKVRSSISLEPRTSETEVRATGRQSSKAGRRWARAAPCEYQD